MWWNRLCKQWANVRVCQQFGTEALHMLQIEHGLRQCEVKSQVEEQLLIAGRSVLWYTTWLFPPSLVQMWKCIAAAKTYKECGSHMNISYEYIVASDNDLDSVQKIVTSDGTWCFPYKETSVFLEELAVITEGQKVPAGSLDMHDDDDGGSISALCITCLFLRVLLLTGKKYMGVLFHVCKAICLFVQQLLIRHGTVCCSTCHPLLILWFKPVLEV